MKPVPTHHQQGNAIFRILVIFAHLCTPMGDPSTPYLNFYGLKHCSRDSFLSSMLKKSDWHPLKPFSTNHQQGIANFRILIIFDRGGVAVTLRDWAMSLRLCPWHQGVKWFTQLVNRDNRRKKVSWARSTRYVSKLKLVLWGDSGPTRQIQEEAVKLHL